MLTSQIAGGHPVPLAQEKGVDDGRSSNPGPVSISQVAGGHPVSLEQEKGVMTGNLTTRAACAEYSIANGHPEPSGSGEGGWMTGEVPPQDQCLKAR